MKTARANVNANSNSTRISYQSSASLADRQTSALIIVGKIGAM